jgi:alkylation response protein AidB-like acyl-CoA dehydrogenase
MSVTNLATKTPLGRAREITPVLEANAAAAEAARTLPAEAVTALADAGLFSFVLPEELGGEACGFREVLEVWEELSHTDGSTGWTAMANGAGAAAVAAFLPDAAAKTIFSGNPAATIGGQLFPNGTATTAEGGYRVSGSWSFGSGSGHANYVAAGFMPLDAEGQPIMAEGGLPEMMVAVVPRDKVDFKDGWFVMGLTGTGSYDYELSEVFVPTEFTFPLFSRTPARGNSLFSLGIMPFTSSGHAAWALGVGRRALDEVAALAMARVRMGDPAPIAQKPTFQKGLMVHEAKLRAARLFVFATFEELQKVADAGAEPTLAQRADVRLATNLATEVAVEAAEFAHRFAGTASIRKGSVLERCFRDIHTGSQHAFISEKVWIDCAEVQLGLVEESLGL